MRTLDQVIHEQIEDIKALASKVEAAAKNKTPKQRAAISNALTIIQDKLYKLCR